MFLMPDATEFVISKCANASFVHLWNEILKRSAIRKDISPPEGSFLHDQFLKHKVKFASNLTYTPQEIDFINKNSFISKYKIEQERDAAMKAYESLKVKFDFERKKINNHHDFNEVCRKFDELKKMLDVKKSHNFMSRYFSKIRRVAGQFRSLIHTLVR
jgi:hypothetical protein